jgi:hypothetical protein
MTVRRPPLSSSSSARVVRLDEIRSSPSRRPSSSLPPPKTSGDGPRNSRELEVFVRKWWADAKEEVRCWHSAKKSSNVPPVEIQKQVDTLINSIAAKLNSIRRKAGRYPDPTEIVARRFVRGARTASQGVLVVPQACLSSRKRAFEIAEFLRARRPAFEEIITGTAANNL